MGFSFGCGLTLPAATLMDECEGFWLSERLISASVRTRPLQLCDKILAGGPRMPRRYLCLLLSAALWAISTNAVAQEKQLEVGLRPLLLLSQGEPSNDMFGGGIVGSWHWKDDWFFGIALDSMSFDYERPQNILGIPQDPSLATIDGSNSFTRLSGWVERRYDRGGKWDWFWNAGLGIASVDEDIVSGPTATGGTFNIITDASTEVHLMGSAGLRRPLGEKWTFTATFHLEHHLTDYEITDTVSGATGKIGSHTPVGLSATLSYRF